VTAVRALLFDLDGTLLDSAPDLVAALNWVRASERLQPLATEQMAMHFSRGVLGLLQAGMPPGNAHRFETWAQLFLDRYAQHSFVDSRLYDGVIDLLDFLDARALPWGIVTNKSERLTHPVLQAAGLAGRASCVVCGDTLERSKPDPAPVRHACALLGAEPESTLFAGDDVRDIQAGRAAGTQTAAVYYGYGSTELDDELVADSLRVHHPRDLIAFLNSGGG
jgi:phosphoglycolate phosphatase